MGPGSLFHDRKRRRIRTVTAASFPYFRLEWRLAAKASNTWKGVLLAEIRREMERLRPVYETGVLRLLLRNNSMLYVALLRSTFDPLTGELPREIVEERFARSLNRLIETGDYTLKDGQTAREAATCTVSQRERTVPSKRSTGLRTPRKRCPARRPTASSWKSSMLACS